MVVGFSNRRLARALRLEPKWRTDSAVMMAMTGCDDTDSPPAGPSPGNGESSTSIIHITYHQGGDSVVLRWCAQAPHMWGDGGMIGITLPVTIDTITIDTPPPHHSTPRVRCLKERTTVMTQWSLPDTPEVCRSIKPPIAHAQRRRKRASTTT